MGLMALRTGVALIPRESYACHDEDTNGLFVDLKSNTMAVLY